ncbi:unnamed protein product [Triticum turgidum subsp. durum]|uniref:DUF4220 domain-containing protein n=1 Tax=Triticum turgidum subsp. durum TaxID=4567 RepID=A0A9R0W6F9_TRITD|nr:unnamed protein product [Triticum turgidum subsp. durum]
MMDFSTVVLWWEEWQLRLLVLGSLFLQYFLAFAAIHRRRSIPSSLRFFIWLAFLGSDALAISALATALLTQQKKTTGGDDDLTRVVLAIPTSITAGGKNGGLQIFWAPVLLLHLAGPDSITAYNIEDNELWKRHIMTVIYKVTGAIYVFYQSWSGESKLLTAAVLLFIAGTLKCVEKPMALKSASIYTLVSSSPFKYDNVPIDVETKISLEDYVGDAKGYFATVKVGDTVDELTEATTKQLRVIPHWLFVDLASTLFHRLKVLHMFLVFDNNAADNLLQSGLCGAFVRLYTKHSMLLSFLWTKSRKMGLITAYAYLNRVLAVCLTISAVALFHQSHKQGYDGNDVKVTYALLWGAAFLEVHALFSNKYDFFTWTNRVAQYNLIASFARGKTPSKLLKLAGFCGCKDYVDQHWYVDHSSSSFPITELVIQQVKAGWKDYIQGVSSYWAFNDRRGQLTIQQEGCYDELCSTLEVPFDESILVWHMATEICSYQQVQVQVHDQGASGDEAAAGHCDAATSCREISNYLVYLFVNNPEMLMAGTRVTILSEACEELQNMFKDDMLPPGEEGDLAEEIHTRAQAMQGAAATATTKAFVLRASNLAMQLLAMNGDRRWKVMQGVWVEMLCFSASRCRGHLHAKSLGMGGEYLSYVWLLLWYMGLESVAERQQRSDFRKQGAPSSSQSWI